MTFQTIHESCTQEHIPCYVFDMNLRLEDQLTADSADLEYTTFVILEYVF